MNKQELSLRLYQFGKTFSGHGIGKFSLVKALKKIALSGLPPDIAEVYEHIMHIDRQDSLRLLPIQNSLSASYETIETKLVKQLVNRGNVVIDVGAHIGYYALILARQVGTDGMVYAFEPEPQNFALLESNVEENRYANVQMEKTDVTSQTGKASLYLCIANSGMHRTHPSEFCDKTPVEVNSVSLDDYFINLGGDIGREIAFIKIDSEGSEYDIIKGAENTLINSPNVVLLVEFSPFSLREAEHEPEGFLRLLKNHGFGLYDLHGNGGVDKPAGISELVNKYSNGYWLKTNLLCKKQDC